MPYILFFALLLLVLGGSGFYISLRLYHCLGYFFKEARLLWVMLAFGAFMVLTAVLFASQNHTLKTVGGYCLALFIYLLVFTVAADLLSVIFLALRQSIKAFSLYRAVAGICVAALSAITVVFGGINARSIEITEYRIETQKDFGSMKIAMISDLHLGSVGSEARLEEIVAEINAQGPDIVCIAGDFIDTDFNSIQDPAAAIETLKKLNPVYGSFMCLGNHDAGSTQGKMLEFAESCGITVLREEYTVIDNRLVLVGRADGSPIGASALKRGDFSSIVPKELNELPIAVLDHNPGRIGEYENTGADLILCGHTHKGQLFPGSVITGLMFEIDYGHLEATESTPDVIVSSGIGYWGMPVKVGTKSEIVVIDIIKQ